MPDKECLENTSGLGEKELDYIASKLQERMYASIGKSVVQKFFWFVGFVTVAVGAYLKSKGII